MPLGSPKAQDISSAVVDSLATLAQMKSYRDFPERLHHRVPHWVEPGGLFQIRIRLDREKQQRTLIDPSLAPALLDSATLYEANMRWRITLFLLMPDHVHAVLSFPRDKSMSEVIRDWKRFHTRTHRVMWPEGYFDHRLRSDERGTQVSAKLNYIRQNPVSAGLCARAGDWPWVIDPFGSEGGSARRGGMMPFCSPKAQISGSKAACVSQRVEDNAFHLGTSGDKSSRLTYCQA